MVYPDSCPYIYTMIYTQNTDWHDRHRFKINKKTYAHLCMTVIDAHIAQTIFECMIHKDIKHSIHVYIYMYSIYRVALWLPNMPQFDNWLVVSSPLGNITVVSWDYEIPNWMEKHVPNHQPNNFPIHNLSFLSTKHPPGALVTRCPTGAFLFVAPAHNGRCAGIATWQLTKNWWRNEPFGGYMNYVNMI